MNYIHDFMFGIYPYLAGAVFFLGSWIRFDRDQYSWKAGSSQMLSSRNFAQANNRFHIGILLLFLGHVVGLLTPPSVYHAVIGTQTKQIMAMVFGGAFGIYCFLGMKVLVKRRLTDPRVRATSSFSDIFILLLIYVQLILGLLTIFVSATHLDGSQMLLLGDWAQRIVTFRSGAADVLAPVSILYKLHIFVGLNHVPVFSPLPVWSIFGAHRYGIWDVVTSLCANGVSKAMIDKPQHPNIRVNGVEITDHAISSEVQYHPADSKQTAYRNSAQALVIRELLLQEAARLNLEPVYDERKKETPEETLVRQLIEQEVETPDPDDNSCNTYFQNNRSRFKTPDLIEASHILLPAPKEAVKARREIKQHAEELLDALKKGASFKKLAKTHSACPSKKEGGSLGQLTPGQTVAEFERQVFPLPEGLAPHPIETRYGYHVVRIDRKVEGRLLEYSFVKEKISQYLKARVQRKAISQYIHHLSGEAKIEGIDLEESDSPLLQ